MECPNDKGNFELGSIVLLVLAHDDFLLSSTVSSCSRTQIVKSRMLWLDFTTHYWN